MLRLLWALSIGIDSVYFRAGPIQSFRPVAGDTSAGHAPGCVELVAVLIPV